MTYDSFTTIAFLTSLDDCGASAEEMTIIEAAPGDAELVDTVAFVALPKPVKAFWGWRQELGTGFELGSTGAGALVVSWW